MTMCREGKFSDLHYRIDSINDIIISEQSLVPLSQLHHSFVCLDSSYMRRVALR